MLEVHLPLDGRQGHPVGVASLFRRRVEDVSQPANGDPDLLEVLPQAGKSEDRQSHPRGQHVEGNQLTDRQIPFDDETGADPERQRDHGLLDEGDALGTDVAKYVRAETCPDIPRQLILPAPLCLRLDSHAFEGFDRGNRLDQKAWFSAPRLNFSSSRRRKIGVMIKLIAT